MDTELFELCKEVYKRTAWVEGPADGWYGFKKATAEDPIRWGHTPRYTSDYLLEKLPKGVTLTHFKDLGYIKREHEWSARMTPAFGRYTTADTPLKAILKLTIALADAGELNHA